MSNATISKSATKRLQNAAYPSTAKPLPWLTKSRLPRRLPWRRTRIAAPSAVATSSVAAAGGTAPIMARR